MGGHFGHLGGHYSRLGVHFRAWVGTWMGQAGIYHTWHAFSHWGHAFGGGNRVLEGIIRHNLAPSMCSQAWVGILVTLEGIIVQTFMQSIVLILLLITRCFLYHIRSIIWKKGLEQCNSGYLSNFIQTTISSHKYTFPTRIGIFITYNS